MKDRTVYSPLLSPEDITQQRELEKLRRPERFRRWGVSRRSIANEILRKEFGRNLDRAPQKSLPDFELQSREPDPIAALIADERADTLAALATRIEPGACRTALEGLLTLGNPIPFHLLPSIVARAREVLREGSTLSARLAELNS